MLAGLKALLFGTPPPTPEESRRAPRARCRYLVRARKGETEFDARVVDISASGMRLEVGARVAAGNRLSIGYLGEDQEAAPEGASWVYCLVVWCRRRPHDDQLLAGVRFADTQENLDGSWVGPVLNDLGLDRTPAATRRKWIRLPTALRCEVRELDSGQHLTEGSVINLSMGGTLLQTGQQLRPGTRVLALFGPFANYPIASIAAKVVSSRDHPVEEAYNLSLEFLDDASDDYKTIEAYLRRMLNDRSLV